MVLSLYWNTTQKWKRTTCSNMKSCHWLKVEQNKPDTKNTFCMILWYKSEKQTAHKDLNRYFGGTLEVPPRYFGGTGVFAEKIVRKVCFGDWKYLDFGGNFMNVYIYNILCKIYLRLVNFTMVSYTLVKCIYNTDRNV